MSNGSPLFTVLSIFLMLTVVSTQAEPKPPHCLPEAIKQVGDWAMTYRRLWEESFGKLDAVVLQMRKESEDGSRDG